MEVSPAAAALMLTVAIGGCAGLAWAASRLARGLPLLAYEPHPVVPWSGVEVLLCFVLFMALPMAAIELSADWIGDGLQDAGTDRGSQLSGGEYGASSFVPSATITSPEDRSAAESEIRIDPREVALRLMLVSAASFVALALSISIVRVRSGATWADLGFSMSRWKRDTLLGILGFFVVFVPVFGLAMLLTQLVQPERIHSVVQSLSKSDDALLLAAAFVATVISAPLVEEFFVRGIFQGWLEKLERERRGECATADTSAAQALELPAAPPRDPGILWASLIGASLLFGLLHVSNSYVDPFPLFVLAMGLGYVYQRTGRLWPCIVLHAFSNSITLLSLVLS